MARDPEAVAPMEMGLFNHDDQQQSKVSNFFLPFFTIFYKRAEKVFSSEKGGHVVRNVA